MSTPLSPCPFLPVPADSMDWRALHDLGARRDGVFYLRCLEYGQFLWRQDVPARAILCLDRAFGADLSGIEPVLEEWPLPYSALVWMLRFATPGRFIGNPRVHFQHLADRLGPPRKKQRSWRAWACWHLTRRVLPDLSGDSRHEVIEPSESEIAAALDAFGIPGERTLWANAIQTVDNIAGEKSS